MHTLRCFATRLLLAAIIAISVATIASAEADDFLFGLWGTDNTYSPWGVGAYRTMRNQYRMNVALDFANDSSDVDSITAAGMKSILVPAAFANGAGDANNLYYRYGHSNYLRYEVEGDTIPFYSDPTNSTLAAYVKSTGGVVVIDAAASGGKALLFRPGVSVADSTVWALSTVLRATWIEQAAPLPVDLLFRIRGTAPVHPDTIVAYLIHRERANSPDTTPDGFVYRQQAVSGADISINYSNQAVSFNIPINMHSAQDNWWTEFGLKWTGKDSLWIDWIADTDPDGVTLEEGTVDQNIKDFVWEWSNDGDSSVVGFWQQEEWYQDAIVYPMKRADSLLKASLPDANSFSEQGHLQWWPSRSQFGGISAAIMNEQRTNSFQDIRGYLCFNSWPLNGYYTTAMTNTPEGPVSVSLKAAVANPPLTCAQINNDTAICFQQAVEGASAEMRFYKEYADSIGARLLPDMQGFHWEDRPTATTCGQDTTWQIHWRAPTGQEAKCLAGCAIANGANGLLYFKYNASAYSHLPGLGCFPDTFYTSRSLGMGNLPDLLSGMETFVGPFVDSLGHYFSEPGFWKGGGRIDLWDDSTGLDLLFDSTARSLTFTGAGQEAFVEAGVFESDSTQYFLLVNRRAYDTIPQTIRTWLSPDSGMYYIVDLYSYDTVLAGAMSGSVPFTTSIGPGEFKFFKIVPVGLSTVAGHTLPQVWEGGIAIGGNVTVDSNRSLTIVGPAEIRVSAGGGYYINAYGQVTVEGEATYPIRFRSSNLSTPGLQDWAGIAHLGPGNLSFKHVSIQDSYRGLWVLNTSSVDTISIDSCQFTHGFFAGIQNDRDTTSPVTVRSSRFADIQNHGIYIYRGRTEIDDCRFRGSLIKGVTFETGNGRPTAGQVKNCNFDSLTASSAIGVYLNMVKNRSDKTSPILASNTFGPHWLGSAPNGQTAIQVNNCVDTLTLFANRIDGDANYGGYKPLYGINNYSTTTWIRGHYDTWPWVDYAEYGVFCLASGSSDSDYVRVRAIKIEACHYGVYLYSTGKADLQSDGTEPNAFTQFCESDGHFSVYNRNANFTVPAQANYWSYHDSLPGCDGWPHDSGLVDHSNSRGSDPFGLFSKRAVPELESSGPLPPVDRSGIENYPNPFNAATVIRFTTPQTGHVAVRVYNVLGQQVRTLWDGDLPEGEHQLTWDGADGRGQPVSSGVYFYRLIQGGRQLTKKMVVVK